MSQIKAMDWNAFHKANKADGPANILAIGTANPANVHRQNEYPDFYFRATNSHHMTGLKKKFQRICEKSAIETRHMYICEDILKDNPQMCTFEAPSSLETRLQMALVQLPELAKEAALKAIKEWGQPKSKITHLVFHTTIGVDMPGADFALIKLLGLNPDVKRVMLYEQGCFAGGTALRIAKDLAENNRGARVLAVCSEITAIMFRGPHEDNMDNLVGQALFGDGAGAMIVGSDPVPQLEKPCFEIWWAEQTILSDTPGGALPIEGNLSHAGLSLHIIKELPDIISTNMERILETALEQFGVSDWNELFWVAHPGGRAILDAIERKLKLNEEKLSSSREVLSEYGNMASACVIFVLDKMRKRSMEKGCATTGQGLDWGVFLGFGPGVTVEALVLKSVPTSL